LPSFLPLTSSSLSHHPLTYLFALLNCLNSSSFICLIYLFSTRVSCLWDNSAILLYPSLWALLPYLWLLYCLSVCVFHLPYGVSSYHFVIYSHYFLCF
jgi:hypothetical protein